MELENEQNRTSVCERRSAVSHSLRGSILVELECGLQSRFLWIHIFEWWTREEVTEVVRTEQEGDTPH